MRATVAIDDNLLARAKQEARRRGTTLGALVEEGLRDALAASNVPVVGPSIPVSRAGGGLAPGIEPTTAGLIAALDEGLPIDKLR